MKLKSSEAKEIRQLSRINRFRVDKQDELKNGVKLSRISRISDPKHLFNLESVSKELKFEGVIRVRDFLNKLLDKERIKAEDRLLKYGLISLKHLGGQKSRGLGRVSINCPQLGLTDSGGTNE